MPYHASHTDPQYGCRVPVLCWAMEESSILDILATQAMMDRNIPLHLFLHLCEPTPFVFASHKLPLKLCLFSLQDALSNSRVRLIPASIQKHLFFVIRAGIFRTCAMNLDYSLHVFHSSHDQSWPAPPNQK